ncbi:MAG: hypothetical protein L0Y54_13015, partial [Sporichthyaceae bacterium]|nr:hypothetical protein [Sporichthyaceae bacterium]
PAAATLRVLGQGTLPPGNGTGKPALLRKAPLGNVSIDDGGTLQSVHNGNVLVFIGEKWHSSSVTIKIHPTKVQQALNAQTTTFTASGGTGSYTFQVLSDAPGTGGSAGSPAVGGTYPGSSFVYTAGTAAAGNIGTAVIRVTDSSGEFYDAVVTYGVAAQGPLFLSPGYPSPTVSSIGVVYYLRTGVTGFTPTVRCDAYAGSGTYSWTVSGTGSLSANSGPTVTFTAGSGSTTGIVVCSDGTRSQTAYMYHNAGTTYGDYYPTPYYMYHLHTATTQTLRMNPAALSTTVQPTWLFTSNPANSSFNSGLSTTTGYSVTLNVGNQAGVVPYSTWVNGQVVSTTSVGAVQTGYFYYYATAYPSSLAISPTLIEGMLPGG